MVLFTFNKKGAGIYGLNIPYTAWAGAIAGVGTVMAVTEAVPGGRTSQNPSNTNVWTGIIVGGILGHLSWKYLTK